MRSGRGRIKRVEGKLEEELERELQKEKEEEEESKGLFQLCTVMAFCNSLFIARHLELNLAL